jgi:peptide/nickel transport system substrate-binding protein/oligopeptide transport system substrate-binding protein
MRLGNRKFNLAGLVVLLGTIALLAAGCGGTSSGPSDKAANQLLKLTWSSGGGTKDITTLDPAECYDSSCIPLTNIIYDSLVTLDKNNNVIPWAAKSWTTTDGGKTYVFTLQANQSFSDGNPVKASDFAWAMDRQFNPCTGFVNEGTSSLFVNPSASAAVVDADKFAGETCKDGVVQGSITTLIGDSLIPDDSANTLTMKFTQPASYILGALTLPFSAALEKSVLGSPTPADLGHDFAWRDNLTKGSTGQGGSGMFYISQWDHNGVLNLKPNPHWWGTKPTFSEVDFNIFTSSDTEYQTYQSDQSYAYSPIPVDQIAAAKSQPDYHEYPVLSVETIGFNWNVAPFNDLNARKAFCAAMNRDALNTSVLKGASVPSWHLVPKGMPGYNADLQGLDGIPTAGDTTKAKAYWQQYLATLNGKPVPPVTLSFNVASASQKALAEAYQATWKELFPEANVTISTVAWATQVQTLFGHTMQLGRFGWLADYGDPQDFLSLLYETGAPNDYFNGSVPEADSLMKQADAIFDPTQTDQRMKLYNQAEQLLVNNVSVCPMFTGNGHYQLRTWVKGGWVYAPNATVPNPAWITGYIASH